MNKTKLNKMRISYYNYLYISKILVLLTGVKMKFAHLADCHLGSWRQPELQQLNLDSFKLAIETCIEKKVSFVLIAGDLFDSAYPPIEILEQAFLHLKKLKDNKIACYYIAGSHDYSASGKTFLSVLESAGFCKNIFQPEIREGVIYLNPIIHENTALYGYPGKKSGMEIQELKNLKLHDSPLFKILALHTCIKNAVGTLPIESIDENELPRADYYALGHLHIDYQNGRFTYAGPIFPDNFQELEELNYGSFYIIDTLPFSVKKISLKIREIENIYLEIKNALTATDKIIAELNKRNLENKIVLLRLEGKIEQGKTSDINFKKIEEFAKSLKAFTLLKSISQLSTQESQINIEVEDVNKLEEEIIKKHLLNQKSKFDSFVFSLVNSLSAEKQEDETSVTFNARLFSELNKILAIDLK